MNSEKLPQWAIDQNIRLMNREPDECHTLGCEEVEVKDEDGNLAHYCKS